MKERAGIQSVEVGFGLLEVLSKAAGPLMLRDLAAAAGMSAARVSITTFTNVTDAADLARVARSLRVR